MNLDDLSIFSGIPAYPNHLYVGRPNIGDRQRLVERLNDMLDRRWLTNRGPYVKEFEARLAEIVGVRHCIAMCNATIALEIAIRAAGLSGEVIVPSMTFIATAHALQWQEITPVFCDIDPSTHNIDPERVEELITPRTTGIIGVHLWGRPCAVERLEEIARRRKLKLIFDAAHAFGCSHHGRMLGSFGDAEVLSFHATKFLNSFEGGAVMTNDDELARKVELMQNFGFETYDRVIYIGTNGKMNEMSAIMGLTSLESMDEFIAVNYAHYCQYLQELGDIPGIQPILYDEGEKCNYHYIVLEVDEALTGLSRDELQSVLWAEGILARRYFFPGCHRMEPYRSYFPHAGLLLPQTERMTRRLLSLPTGTAVEKPDIHRIGDMIHTAVAHSVEVHRQLQIKHIP